MRPFNAAAPVGWRQLKGVLTGEEALPKGRVEFMQYHQSTVVPSKWESSVVSDQWRLVRGKELYDIKADPGQNRDIAGQHPEVVRRLRAAHEAYWQEMQGTMGYILRFIWETITKTLPGWTRWMYWETWRGARFP